jgi:hypothetical protein
LWLGTLADKLPFTAVDFDGKSEASVICKASLGKEYALQLDRCARLYRVDIKCFDQNRLAARVVLGLIIFVIALVCQIARVEEAKSS